jgi:hypothetical protein
MSQFVAVAARVLVNVESARERPLLAQASQQLGLPARVALRLAKCAPVVGPLCTSLDLPAD